MPRWAFWLLSFIATGATAIRTINPLWSTSIFATPTEAVLEYRQSPCSDHGFYLGKGGNFWVANATYNFTFSGLASAVNSWVDHGALGMELHPDFANGKPYVYIWLATVSNATAWPYPCPIYIGGVSLCRTGGRLVRLTLDVNVDEGGICTDIGYRPLDNPPYTLLSGFCSTSSTHGVGDIKFYNRTLLLTAGEGSQATGLDVGTIKGDVCYDPNDILPQGRFRSQRLNYLSGKLLQLDADAITSSNGELQYPRDIKIIAIGFRNPYSMAVDPSNMNVYVGDVGSFIREEINMLTPADFSLPSPVNFGWPCIEGSKYYGQDDKPWLQSSATCSSPNDCSICDNIFVCNANAPGKGGCDANYRGPAFEFRGITLDIDNPTLCKGSSSSIAGLAMFRGDAPQFGLTGASYMPHNLVAIDYATGCMFMFNPTSPTDNTPNFAAGAHLLATDHFVASLHALPDGYLYAAGPNAPYNIYRHGVVTSDAPPYAVLKAQFLATVTPRSYAPCAQTCQVAVGATVYLTTAGSSGGGSAIASYTFDFGDGKALALKGPMATSSATYVYKTVGMYIATVNVTNAHGDWAVASWPILVGQTVSISMTPPSGAWKLGENISYALEASSIDLNTASIVVTASVSHCFPNACTGTPDCHVHPYNVNAGFETSAAGTLSPPEHAWPSQMQITFAIQPLGFSNIMYFTFTTGATPYSATLQSTLGTAVMWWPVINGELGPCVSPCAAQYMALYTAPLSTNAVQTDYLGNVYALANWTSTGLADAFGLGNSSTQARLSSDRLTISANFVPIATSTMNTQYGAPPRLVAVTGRYMAIEVAWELPPTELRPWDYILVSVRTAALTNIKDFSATFPMGASTVIVPVPAAANNYTVMAAGYNFTAFSKTAWGTAYPVSTSSDSALRVCTFDPFGPYPSGSARPVLGSLPTTIEAEAYALGGNGVGYYDTTAGNQRSITVRNGDDVDIMPPNVTANPSVLNFGVIDPDAGEWLAYPVTVATAGYYTAAFNFNSPVWVIGRRVNRKLCVQLDKANCNAAFTGCAVDKPRTFASTDPMVSAKMFFASGDHTLRVCFVKTDVTVYLDSITVTMVS